jgi:hypothetical protein
MTVPLLSAPATGAAPFMLVPADPARPRALAAQEAALVVPAAPVGTARKRKAAQPKVARPKAPAAEAAASGPASLPGQPAARKRKPRAAGKAPDLRRSRGPRAAKVAPKVASAIPLEAPRLPEPRLAEPPLAELATPARPPLSDVASHQAEPVASRAGPALPPPIPRARALAPIRAGLVERVVGWLAALLPRKPRAAMPRARTSLSAAAPASRPAGDIVGPPPQAPTPGAAVADDSLSRRMLVALSEENLRLRRELEELRATRH